MKVVKMSESRLLMASDMVFLKVILALGLALCLAAVTATGEMMFAYMALVVGALLVLMWGRIEVRFDRQTGVVTRLAAFPLSRSRKEVPLAAVLRAEAEEDTEDGTHRLSLVTCDGIFPLDPGWSSMTRDAQAAEINGWLGLGDGRA